MAMNRQSFEIALKKGEAGEQIIRDYLERRGWVVYFPFTKNRAHYFDMLATKNKEKVIAIDVKTKARLNKWAAQGINKKSYDEYMKFVDSTNVPFYIVFVDDKLGDVHAQDIKRLTRPIRVNDKILAWLLSDMKFLFNIGPENIRLLSGYDQRNYDFTPMESYK
jgi:hypothetical protein